MVGSGAGSWYRWIAASTRQGVGARATVATVEGNLRQAAPFVDASLALFRQIDDPYNMGWALDQRGLRLAGAAATFEDRVDNIHSSSASLALPAPWIEYQRVLASVRTHANAPGFATAWAEGQQMTLDQAVEYALSD